ncbi:MAG: hypothetical protein K9N00_04590 [Candidatus Marinimicrobia bacterium]|nr:hypothetical protein [Candidatus Neomarinimicrobiota bacterium]
MESVVDCTSHHSVCAEAQAGLGLCGLISGFHAELLILNHIRGSCKEFRRRTLYFGFIPIIAANISAKILFFSED